VDKLDPDDPRPAYVQVSDALRAAIEDGSLRPGQKLPTHAELVADYGVSLGTVKKALAGLQSDGLIVSRQGGGAFVRTRPPEPPIPPGDAADLRAAISDLARRMDGVERRLAEL
jgi:DNA-binding GntR family transcriptional regulator